MHLHWSSRSPFVRKVLLVAYELDLADRIKLVRSPVSPFKANEALIKLNPLSKLPTLVLDDETVLYDSRVIVHYLDTVAENRTVLPKSNAQLLEVLRIQALCDGILDFLILELTERWRAEEHRSSALLEACEHKLTHAISELERGLSVLDQMSFNLAHICTGTVLSYMDFRFPHADWRRRAPKLDIWFPTFASRLSAQRTAPYDDGT